MIITCIFAASSADALVRIMPLGDSITYGMYTSPDPRTEDYITGYRQPLYIGLTELGYDVDFVGNRLSGSLAEPDFDVNHEGYGGICASKVADDVYSQLVQNPADIVLLHIGTNCLTTDTEEVERILDNIYLYDIDITVFLALIIDRVPHSPDTSAYNLNLQAMASQRKADGDSIVVVDMEHALNYSDDMADWLHPNDDGYGKMADAWQNALVDFLGAVVPDPPPPPIVSPSVFDEIVVFGDSLSDNGNLFLIENQLHPDPALYYQGRFSNGPVWVEYLADLTHMNAPLDDRALGGAQSDGLVPPGLIEQVTSYTAAKALPLSHDSLFIIWIGGNDFLNGNGDFQNAVDNINRAMERLAALEAQHILLLNLPDLGAIPDTLGTSDATPATAFSLNFNAELVKMIDRFSIDHPEVTLYEFDVFSFFAAVQKDPAAFGFSNVTEPSPNFQIENNFDGAGHLFWDDRHPTTAMHALLADRVSANLDAHVPPSSNPDENDDGDPVPPPPTDSDQEDDGGGSTCFISSSLW
ncbi:MULTISPECIES: SGNH/GDSL hydrolase family protein [Desulfococcus]|uniref:SGNH/GDSL hydrolase family protein n=1 Tax=Desulfococcus TaxID=896 RepID=UPI001356505A|nr:SGNH/GDSL hydrolase family protein [Desulfococcus multivorans]